MKKLTPFFFFVLLLASCNERKVDKRPTKKAKVFAKITTSAGELLPGFDSNSIPTFFNIGMIDDEQNLETETIILGKSLSGGRKYGIELMGMLTFYKDSIPYTYIVSHIENDEVKPKNFEKFMIENYALKDAIESWFTSQGGQFNCRNFEWSSNYKALLKLDDKSLKN